MTSDIFGWCGKILDVDLTRSRITHRNTLDYAGLFLGGRGIATRIYWEDVPPEVKAFDPENRLILMTGPLGATGAQGASRFEVVGKSPMLLPEGFCYGNLGGFFGPYLKRAGYDGLVISGKAEKPVYLWIEDEKVEIRDAASLWGQGVYAVSNWLKETHGQNTRFVTMGVAGENLCRTSNLMTDNEGSATGGFGAVMGSKHLKAVAVLGTGNPQVAHPEDLKALSRKIIALNKRAPAPAPFPPDQVVRSGKASCYQCGIDCTMRNTYRTASGREMVRKCQAMFVYSAWSMRRPGEPAETSLDATGICNDLSLCTMEMSNVIAWLAACHKSGYLTSEQIGVDMTTLGTRSFFENLARMIAHRQGLGDILAQGLLRAGEKLGAEARKHFSNEVSGVGAGASYSAREYMMNGLLYAFEPRQPIAMLHEISRIIGQWVVHQDHPEASPVSSDVYRAAAKAFWNHDKAWDLNSPEGKAMAATRIIDRTLVKDSLGLCDSSWPLMVTGNTPDRLGDPALESQLFSAVTGMETGEEELYRYGERIFNLERAILLREGRRAKVDDVPAEFNFTDPVQTVFMNPKVLVPGPGDEVLSRRGKVLKRKDFETMRKEFYELRGWDPDTGLQKPETLEKLALT
jgi:aldehyde:ferredoxin oxidoreductase